MADAGPRRGQVAVSRRFRLKPRDRRALLVGLVVVAPVATFRVAISPWLSHVSELRRTLAAERGLLARERAMIVETQQLPERVRALDASLDSVRRWLLPGASAMDASGALSRYVTSLGKENGILVQQAETRPGGAVSGTLQSTSLSVRALGDLEGVVRLLHDLENGPRLLHVDALSIHPAGVNDGDLDRGELLSASLLVTGYWIGADEAPADVTTAAGSGGA